MRVLLISPQWAGLGNRRKVKVREREVHPLGIGVVAALSSGHDVRVVDEHLERVPFDEPWDLVGITCATYQAPRAFSIADRFGARGVPVVMGGVHATLMPRECLRHSKAVVRGEAERAWGQVLADGEARRLQPLYEGGVLDDMARVPAPRRDLYRPQPREAAYVQATRGCGGRCTFCYLGHVGWGAFRPRPVAAVVEELRALAQRFVLFVDDNLWADRAYAVALFDAMAPLGKLWWAQAPVTVGEDHALLEAARSAGCFALSIGFKSINRAAIGEARVVQNRVDQYCETVRAVRSQRILVDGTFIFGFDSDPPTIFRDTVAAIRELGLDAHTFYLLTPYPGTTCFEQLEREGRIVDHNWAHYDWDHAVLQPLQITLDQLRDGVAWAYRELERSPGRWAMRQVIRNGRTLMRSPRLAMFLLRQNWPQRHDVNY